VSESLWVAVLIFESLFLPLAPCAIGQMWSFARAVGVMIIGIVLEWPL
jgi:hypothetical protein